MTPELGVVAAHALHARIEGALREQAMRHEADDTTFRQPGIFIGWRTLTDGTAEWEDEVGYVFDADAASRQVAALVVYDKRRSPVLVPCDALAQP
jgi:hypothetical protein